MTISTEFPLTDEEVIRSFPRYQGAASPDHVIDFLGTKTRIAYISMLAGGGSSIEDYPIPTNFHATALEWAGVLRAVLTAGPKIVACELGAGWAPWLVTVARAAQLRGVAEVHLVGVEASEEHCDYMRSHFADNGLDVRQHTLLQGIVAQRDGVAEFPTLLDPAHDWGAAAVNLHKSPAERLARRVLRPVRAAAHYVRHGKTGASPVERITSYSIPTLLKPFERVDLVHIDIQGHEYEVLRCSRQALKRKVRRLVIGTHSRLIEEKLLAELAGQGWILEADESCRYRQEQHEMFLSRDGCQVWHNPALDSC